MHRALLILYILITSASCEQKHLLELPTSKQSGPTCAFHANIPALTHLTGININDGSPTSKTFITSVYSLKNGDQRMTRPFSRKAFFHLFGIETTFHKTTHPNPTDPTQLAKEILKKEFNPALTNGHLISLRTTGRLGKPHNILLLTFDGKTYHYHNPTTGKIHSASPTKFAPKILTKTTATKNRTRPDYQTNYHIIKNNLPPLTKITSIKNLPPNQSITLTKTQKQHLQTLKPPTRNLIQNPLKPHQATGIINLAKLAINAHPRHKKNPIIFINNEPHAITAYQGPFHPITPNQRITIHNGTTQKTIPTINLLKQLQPTNYQLTYHNLHP